MIKLVRRYTLKAIWVLDKQWLGLSYLSTYDTFAISYTNPSKRQFRLDSPYVRLFFEVLNIHIWGAQKKRWTSLYGRQLLKHTFSPVNFYMIFWLRINSGFDLQIFSLKGSVISFLLFFFSCLREKLSYTAIRGYFFNNIRGYLSEVLLEFGMVRLEYSI